MHRAPLLFGVVVAVLLLLGACGVGSTDSTMKDECAEFLGLGRTQNEGIVCRPEAWCNALSQTPDRPVFVDVFVDKTSRVDPRMSLPYDSAERRLRQECVARDLKSKGFTPDTTSAGAMTLGDVYLYDVRLKDVIAALKNVHLVIYVEVACASSPGCSKVCARTPAEKCSQDPFCGAIPAVALDDASGCWSTKMSQSPCLPADIRCSLKLDP